MFLQPLNGAFTLWAKLLKPAEKFWVRVEGRSIERFVQALVIEHVVKDVSRCF